MQTLSQLPRLTLSQAAKLAETSTQTIRHLIDEAKIESTRTDSGIVYIETSSLLAHLKLCQNA